MVLKAKQEAVRVAFEKFMKVELLKEWTAQGHFMDGKVVKEMDLVIEQTFNSVSFLFYFLPYGTYIESGVPASRIPFSGATGQGGKSMYIQGLISYALKKLQVANLAEAKSAAFAIAHTHKKEGMPGKASARFSSTGKRTEWINETFKNNRPLIRQFLLRYVEGIFTVKFDNIILKFSKEFKTTV